MKFMLYLDPTLRYLMQKQVLQNLNHFNFKHFGSQAFRVKDTQTVSLSNFLPFMFDYINCNLLYNSPPPPLLPILLCFLTQGPQSSCCPITCSVGQAGLELIQICLSPATLLSFSAFPCFPFLFIIACMMDM